MATSPKPGIKTTEFWISLVTAVGGPSAILSFVGTQLDPAGLAAVIVSSVAAAAAVVWKYVQSRQVAKSA